MIADGVNAWFYYAPFATTNDSNGNITTLLAAGSRSTGEVLYPSKVTVNCTSKVVRTDNIDLNGNWTKYSNWVAPEKGTVNAQIIDHICLVRGIDGSTRQFINMMPDAKMPNNYTYYWWELDKNYAVGTAPYKTFKVFQANTGQDQLTYIYYYANCSSRTFALNQDLSAKNLAWNSEAVPNSTFGFLMTKACGTKPANTSGGS